MMLQQADMLLLVSIMSIILYVTLLIQVRHCFATAETKNKDLFIIEVAIAVHLFAQLIAAFSYAAERPLVAIVRNLAFVRVEVFVSLSIIALVVCVIQSVRMRYAQEIPSILVITANIPARLMFPGNLWVILLALDALYFLVRGTYFTYLIESKMSIPSTQQLAVAVNMLPTGLAINTADGDSLYMNDAMRQLIGQLGLQTDNADTREVMRAIGLSETEESQLKLKIGDATYLVSSEIHKLNGKKTFAITAHDITIQEQLNSELAILNDQMQERNTQLQKNLAAAEAAAKTEAVIQMKSRIHDVVGQRLSILHRCLEDDDLSPETIDQIRPILENLIDDLDPSLKLTPRQEARTIVEAFALSGVTVRLFGAIPDDETAAALFVRAIREGSTNAVKHAQTNTVLVNLGSTADQWSLSIENENPMGKSADQLGTGLRELKARTESLGGTFSVNAEERFILHLTVPKNRKPATQSAAT